MISQEILHNFIAGFSFIIIFLATQKLWIGEWINKYPVLFLIVGIVVYISSNKISKMIRGSNG